MGNSLTAPLLRRGFGCPPNARRETGSGVETG